MPTRRPVLVAATAALLLTACGAPAPTHRGEVQGDGASVQEWGQSDMNRVATVAMRENLLALHRLADKLYRRNPAEWRRGGAASREQAVARLRSATLQRSGWPALGQRRDIDALALALSPGYEGDRVAGFLYAVADMLITAHGGKTEFYLLDGQDAQHLYNAARNLEVAVWMLAQRRGAGGAPLLLADEINGAERNLSYEREFGKIIARLDLVAQVSTEKYRRAVIGYAQGVAGGTFLQFLPVR